MSGTEAAGISLALVREVATLLARLRNFNRRMRDRPAHLEALASHFSHVEREFDAIRGEIEGFDPAHIDLESPGARILLNLIQKIDDCLRRLSSRLEYLQGMSAPSYLGNVRIQNETDEAMAEMQTIRNEIDFHIPSLRFWLLQIQTKRRPSTDSNLTRSPRIRFETPVLPQRHTSDSSTFLNGSSNCSHKLPLRATTVGSSDRPPTTNKKHPAEVSTANSRRLNQPAELHAETSTLRAGNWTEQHHRRPSEVSTIESSRTVSHSRRPSEASTIGTDTSTLWSPRPTDHSNFEKNPRFHHRKQLSDTSTLDGIRSSTETGRISHGSGSSGTGSSHTERSEIELAVREFDIEKVRRLLRNDKYGDLRRTRDSADRTLMDILICQTPRTHSEYLPLMKLLLDKKVKFTLRKDVKLLKIYGELRGVLCL